MKITYAATGSTFWKWKTLARRANRSCEVHTGADECRFQWNRCLATRDSRKSASHGGELTLKARSFREEPPTMSVTKNTHESAQRTDAPTSTHHVTALRILHRHSRERCQL
jgi:hypothetical protein